MKKNLFRKFLALFLTGTLLAGVGCKDYDDDIKEINNKIEGLETGKLASLEEQLNSLKVTIRQKILLLEKTCFADSKKPSEIHKKTPSIPKFSRYFSRYRSIF